MASVVKISGFSVFWRTGAESSISTAMDTPFSFIPSRQIRAPGSVDNLDTMPPIFRTDRLSSATVPTER